MSVGQAANGPGGARLLRVLQAPLSPRTWAAAAYLVASLAVGLFWFMLLATGLSLGLATVVIWVGVPILALTMLAWRGGAWLERRWVGLALGVRIPDPYLPVPPGGLMARWRALAADPGHLEGPRLPGAAAAAGDRLVRRHRHPVDRRVHPATGAAPLPQRVRRG
jgi:hypothetical protein